MDNRPFLHNKSQVIGKLFRSSITKGALRGSRFLFYGGDYMTGKPMKPFKKHIRKAPKSPLPANPGKRKADDTVYHDVDGDRTKWTRPKDS